MKLTVKYSWIKITGFLLSILVIACIQACKKFVTVDIPASQPSSMVVFSDDGSATAAMVGVYSEMVQSSINFSSGSQSISLLTGLSADELQNHSTAPEQREIASNSITSTNAHIQGIWQEFYKYIYSSNAILEGTQNNHALSLQTLSQLQGEAKFMRAFCHFYLTNLFGDVPLLTTTDYQKNRLASRTPQSQVYQQVVADLLDAQNLLASDYSFFGGERIRPTKWAATALLARVYLYLEDWQDAETQASLVMNNNSLFSLVSDLNQVFMKNSQEAIWQLLPVLPGYNTFDGFTFILTGPPTIVTITPELYSSFESGDKRRNQWIDSLTVNSQGFYFPYKYKIRIGSPVSEYLMIFRLSELYLIRAEARAKQNKLINSADDLNQVRQRAGLTSSSSADMPSLVNSILNERRHELFTEWGHRWLDLKRTKLSDAVLGPMKGTNWKSSDTLYPIPQSDILSDPNLTQNSGY